MGNEDYIAVRIFWNDSLSLGTWIPKRQQFQTPSRPPVYDFLQRMSGV
jgi:hypothetical protein